MPIRFLWRQPTKAKEKTKTSHAICAKGTPHDWATVGACGMNPKLNSAHSTACHTVLYSKQVLLHNIWQVKHPWSFMSWVYHLTVSHRNPEQFPINTSLLASMSSNYRIGKSTFKFIALPLRKMDSKKTSTLLEMVTRLVYEQHLKLPYLSLVSQDPTTTKEIDVFKFEKKSPYSFYTH